jgi:hypothetical protein
MDVEGEDLPVPRGIGTSLLVESTRAEWEDPRGITIRRYFMRLRILWFFLCSIPILIVAFTGIALLSAGAQVILGRDVPAGLGTAVVIAGLIAIVAVEVKAAAVLFRWLTRDYRARLIARATEIEAARIEAASQEPQAPLSLAELAELDARHAPPPKA